MAGRVDVGTYALVWDGIFAFRDAMRRLTPKPNAAMSARSVTIVIARLARRELILRGSTCASGAG